MVYDGPRAALDLGTVDDDASDATHEDPQTLEDFVRRMRRESRQLGDVFLMEGEREDSRRRSTEADLPRTPDAVPAAWARSVLADFSDLRRSLEEKGALGVGGKHGPRMAVPRLKDSRGWHRFCFGETEAFPESEDEEDSLWPVHDRGTAPSVRLLLQFDFVMTQKLVALHAGWLESTTLSRNRALWLYALLARLHKPLHRDTCAVLRQLVKRLLALRATTEDAAALMALLVLAGRYFDQASSDEIGSF